MMSMLNTIEDTDCPQNKLHNDKNYKENAHVW